MKKSFKNLFVSSGIFLAFICSGCNVTPNVSPESEGEPTPSEVDETIYVSGVSLNKSEVTVLVGLNYQLIATVTPQNADNKKVIWSSSDESIATVEDGLVTALSDGQATITVTTEDGNYTASCLVKTSSVELAVTGVSLNYDSYAMEVGDSITLIETIIPNTATNQNVTWESSDSAVVEVSNGTIRGVSAGTATITVTTEDGGFTASCEVTVTEKASDDTYDPTGRDDVIFITNADETYSFDGELNKQIYVNAPGLAVTIELNGVTLTYGENSPIYVKACDSIDISAKKGSTNTIRDTRSVQTEEDSSQGAGAIYVADGDLTLKGKGSLIIEAGYNNAIHGKDDVEIKNLTLGVTAPNNGIKGNDSIEIDAATITVNCGNDGLKTSNSDVSSKGKQRGDITITSGNLTVNALRDAISAAHDVVVSETAGNITLKTDKYSGYAGDVVDDSDTSFYLKLSSSQYSSYGSSYEFAAYINENWYEATYKGEKSQSSGNPMRPGPGGGGPGGGGQPGGQSTYHLFEFDKPSDASTMVIYMFNKGASYSTSNYVAKGSANFSSVYNMLTLSSVSAYNKTLSFGSWSSYDSISSKGLKANNAVLINGGTIDIKALDDAIHANNDVSLENGEKPLGNVTVSGGNITVYSDDDGLHADGTLEIAGGEIQVTYAFEGLEGNIINISGGSSYVFGSDDAVNASSGNATPAINVTGGYLDCAVNPSTQLDADCIDSNGTYTQSGGVVITKGPNGSMQAALDSDGAVKLSGGSLIIFGSMEKTPSVSGMTKTTKSGSFSGTKTISFTSESYTTTLNYTYSGFICYSELGTATLS